MGPQHPQSRHEGRSLNLSSVSSMTLSHHSQDIPQAAGPLAETPLFNVPHHVLQQYPLAPIREHSHPTGFTPVSSLTPYQPLAGDPLPGYPIASPSRESPSVFMEPLSQLIHPRLEAPCTPSHSEGLTLFRVPYPMSNSPTAPTMFVHSLDPCLITGDNPLASKTQRLTLAEEEYLCTFQLVPPTAQEAPQVPEPPL